MRWKIYFCLILLANIYTIIKFPMSNVNLNGIMAHGINPIIETLGLFAYVFNKRIFTSTFWKVVFWYLIIGTAARFLYQVIPSGGTTNLEFVLGDKSNLEGERLLFLIIFAVIAFLILGLPLYYAIYHLGKGVTQKNNKSTFESTFGIKVKKKSKK